MQTSTAPTAEKIFLTVDSTKEYVWESFGINETRRDELCELIENEHNKKDSNIVDDLAQLAAATTNHNELAFVSFTYGLYIQDSQNGNPLSAIQRYLDSLN